jgi:hypothetical protein
VLSLSNSDVEKLRAELLERIRKLKEEIEKIREMRRIKQ